MSTEKRIFYSICLISFVGPFLSTSINIAIPVMAGQFGVTPDRMSWVVTIFLMTTAAFLLPLGKVSDVHGRRRTYSLSLVVFAMATAAAAFAQTLTGLIVLRAIQGIALSGVYVSYMPLLLATTDEAHQGHILGRAVALTYLGLSLGPVIGGALTQFVGWRCIFLLSALAIVLSYAFIRPIKEEWYANGAPFVNLVSTALSVSGILCALYGLSSFEDYSAFFWAGLVLLAAFVIHEGKSFHPLLPLYLFRNLTFSMSNLAALIQYSSTYAVSFLLSLYFQVILGLPPAVSGAILLVQPIIMAFLSPRAGDLSDKYGPRGIASMGLVLTALGHIPGLHRPGRSPIRRAQQQRHHGVGQKDASRHRFEHPGLIAQPWPGPEHGRRHLHHDDRDGQTAVLCGWRRGRPARFVRHLGHPLFPRRRGLAGPRHKSQKSVIQEVFP